MDELREKLHKNKTIIVSVISFLFFVLTYKFFSLQILENEIYFSRSEQNRIREVIVKPTRGLIYNRNGELIVDNRPAFSIYMIPYEVTRSESIIPFFVRNNFIELDVIKEKIKKARMVFNPVKLVGQIDFRGLSIIEENKLDLPGIVYQSEPKRFYPLKSRATHLLGHIGEINEREIDLLGKDIYEPGDIIGIGGIERQYENILYGKKGYKYIQVDVHGREVESTLLAERRNIPPVPGKNLYLTIDHTLQQYGEELLKELKGSVILLDARNGEVLTMVSKPDYDPHFFSRNFTPEEWKKLSEDPSHILINRATVGEYPAGSTFKIISAIAALNEQLIKPTWARTCLGSFRLGRRSFDCFRHTVHGKLNLFQAIERSCNVYFYQLGLLVGIDNWSKYAKIFKFGDKTGIDLPEEKSGNVPTKEYMDKVYGEKQWGKGHMVNMAIGQGDLLVTTLQMAVFAMTLGNEGIRYDPHLVKYYEGHETNEKVYIKAKADTVSEVSESVYKVIKQGMYLVVNGEKGTGRACKLYGIDVAGKTGTAENPHGKDHAWFIGYAPVNNPEVAVCVMLENGGVGGSVAAPIARKILKKYFDSKPVLISKR